MNKRRRTHTEDVRKISMAEKSDEMQLFTTTINNNSANKTINKCIRKYVNTTNIFKKNLSQFVFPKKKVREKLLHFIFLHTNHVK